MGFGVLAACGLTCVVNPFGVEMPWTWLEIMDSPILPQIIVEHSPLRPDSPEGMMVLLFGAVYVLALVGLGKQWPRVTWLVPLVWLVLTVMRIRHAPLFSLTALIALADLFPQTRWAQWLARSGSDWYRPVQVDSKAAWHWRASAVPALVVILAIALQWFGVEVPVVGRGWAKLDERSWPVELLPELQAHEYDGSRRIFNEYAYGGFLIYYTPGYEVFVDDRCELYGDRWLLRYVQAETQDTGVTLDEMQRRHGTFDLALTATGSGYDAYFHGSSDWQPLKQTSTATLYRRKS